MQIDTKEDGLQATVSYNRDIRPILSDKCFACHGPDTAAREAELRLDKAEDGEDYFGAFSIIEPGDPANSELVSRIHSTKSRLVMPPPSSNLSLSDQEKRLIEKWIEQGAKHERHWAFVPLPEQIQVPQVNHDDWSRDEIDHFVLARLEEQGLSPNREALRERWLRRVTFDLTGLPSRPGDIQEFLDDQTSGAHERVVDRLLTSPHYGERMATQWIDLARYADSYGYQSDQLSPTWPWRDWLIKAFNHNLSYDKFVTWQIAGDLLPNATRDQQLATAFNRLHRMTNEGGSINEEWLDEYAADRVHTFGTAFLGLTFECARCHDHRYDPIEQRDYFQLYAFFNSIDEWGTYHDAGRVPTPSLLLPNPEQKKRLETLTKAADQSRLDYEKVVEKQSAEPFQNWLQSASAPETVPGLQGHYPLDAIDPGNRFLNLANEGNKGSTNPLNTIVEGKSGKALAFAGDADASFGHVCGGLQPHEAFAVSFWLKLPKSDMTGVIFHRTGGSDVGYHGTDLVVEDGHLFFRMMRYWPGNAIAVKSKAALPAEQWVQVTVSYDASFSAKGMAIYIDGEPTHDIYRDNLYKYPQHGGHGLTFGHRFRGPTLPGSAIDELKAFNRSVTPIEARDLFDGQSLSQAFSDQDASSLLSYYLVVVDQQVAKARQSRIHADRELLSFQTGLTETSIMQDLPTPRPTHVLARGAYDAPRDDRNRVERATPDALIPFPPDAPRNRLGLAQWLTDDKHPLTSRVAVNRLWQVCFGNGLVETSDNFGLQGSWPSHPELLDYLARAYVDSGWDTKAMLKRIVLSAAYRQDSRASKERWAEDPRNILLSRGPSRRLSAEMIRDLSLASSGLLNDTIGGPPVAPYQPPKLWRESNSMSPAYRQSVGRDLYRRSVYTVWKRTAPMPNMLAFDAPGREICTAKRSETNTPMQALVLLNDVQFVEACRVLAERVLTDRTDAQDAGRVQYMFTLLVGRLPDEEEQAILLEVLAEQRELFAERPGDIDPLRSVGEAPINQQLEAAEVAAWTIVAQAILNYDATVWSR